MSWVVFFIFFGVSTGRWIQLGDKREAEVKLMESDIKRTVLEFKLNGYYEEEFYIDGNIFTKIWIPGSTMLRERGLPELPKFTENLIIPDNHSVEIRIIDAEYIQFKTYPIVPSKGHITRNIDPEKIPYTFDIFYRRNEWFPLKNVELSEPFILRDFRGITVLFYPFRYNPSDSILEVCKRIVIEVVAKGSAKRNPKRRRVNIGEDLRHIDLDFLKIYRNFFLNFEIYESRYNPIPEPGRLLIITHSDFLDEIIPLFNWKLQKGIPTKLALYPDSTGIGANSIKAYIQNEYDSDSGVTYIILVGDLEQIPTLYGTYEGAPSDPCYVKLEGDDAYPDAFISRISAQNGDQVSVQVEKVIMYEEFPDTGVLSDWYHKGIGIGSDEDGGTGIPDWMRCDWLRDSLLNYTYTHVDQIYDPGATASQVTDALNEGRSILNYIGHGSGTSWGTTGFSNSHVYQLNNGYKNPFIVDVACLNGDFTMGECFAEAWLRAGSPTSPKGAIGMYASSTLASWVPPCVMQMEVVHLLVSEQRNSLGGLAFNGVMEAMDEYAGTGEDVKLMEQYNLFGDCSLILRTDSPQEMTVTHSPVIPIGSETYEVHVEGVQNALAALYKDGVLYGSGYSDSTGYILIELSVPLYNTGEMTLTVTAYNRIPYITTVYAVQPEGPFVIYSDHQIVDTTIGNGDGVVNPGETVEMPVWVVNIGSEEGLNLSGILRTEDDFVNLIDSVVSFGNLSPGDTGLSVEPFSFSLDPLCPDEHSILFELTVSDISDSQWTSFFSITVKSPSLSFVNYLIDDSLGGDGDGMMEPGEQINLRILVENSGSATAGGLSGILLINDPYIIVSEDSASFPNISPGDSLLSSPFSLSISPDCPVPHLTPANLILSALYGYTAQDSFILVIGETGFVDDMENGEGEWTHLSVTPGYGDEWNLSSARNYTPGGEWSWHCAVADTYSNTLDGALVTPYILLGPNSFLTFYHWMDAETSSTYTGYCYDGGIVEISTDSGATWQQIFPKNGYPFRIRYGGSPHNPFPEQTWCFSGHFEWRQDTFDLSDYIGVVQIRFRFGSDRSVTGEGWYIDDVYVGSHPVKVEEPYHRVYGTPCFKLGQNYPNPFYRMTTISFTVPIKGIVKIKIYDSAGRLVKKILESSLEPGFYQIKWDGTDSRGRRVSSGVYFYRLESSYSSSTRKMVLLR
jgi:hypothetical protein